MPNVRIQGYFCVMKISELFIGSNTLLKNSIIDKLIFDDKINDINHYSIITLYNVNFQLMLDLSIFSRIK
jgi:hypothetical protein